MQARAAAQLPQELRAILTSIARLAGASGAPAYLVGGAVRDHLLGRPILDVDLAVEGDAVSLARQVAESLGLDLRVHETFGTAILRTGSGRRIDLAATRAERYAEAAALPTVGPASLAEDLRRRDFTVNSMAMPLGALDVDALIDPCEGRRDLESRLLRVHHERSFLDDPTRILRGVRFEARLGFTLDPETERLARGACAAGAFDPLSADRLRAELVLLFEEAADTKLLWRRLGGLGVPAAVGLAPGSACADLLSRVDGTLAGWGERHGAEPRVSRSATLLAAVVLAEAPGRRRAAAAERLGLRAGRLDAFEALMASIERPELPPHQAAATLDRLELEELALLEAVGGPGARERVAEHLAGQRDFELAIDGSMLLARGFAAGPEIGDALRATRAARLDGLITAGEELDFAVDLLRRQGRGE